jgi:hypothetical protein
MARVFSKLPDVVKVELRPGALQVLGIDHAIEGRQLAVADALLQATREMPSRCAARERVSHWVILPI